MLLLLLLSVVLWAGGGRACPSLALQSISTPQAAYFARASQYEFSFPCLGDATPTSSRVIHFTPPVSGNYFAKVESLAEDDAGAALSLVTNLCNQSSTVVVVACAASSPGLGVGFDSVHLSQGELYSFLLRTPASDKRNLLTVFLLPPTPISNSTTTNDDDDNCLSNHASSLPQTIALSARHALVRSTQCNGGGVAGKQALYASFTAQLSGNYYVRVVNSPSDLMMEIRETSCLATTGSNGGALACNDDLQSVRSTGFNSLALKADTTYVVLVTAMGSAKAVLGVRALDVGFCGTACTRFEENSEDVSGDDGAGMLGFIIPVATLGLMCAITLALWIRQRLLFSSTSTTVAADLRKSSLAEPVVADRGRRNDGDDDNHSATTTDSNKEIV